MYSCIRLDRPKPAGEVGAGQHCHARFLLIEDCEILRAALTELLNASGRFEQVAHAEGLGQALIGLSARPTVVLVGPGNPNTERMDVVAGVLSNAPEAKIVVLLLQDDDELIGALAWTGFSAWLTDGRLSTRSSTH
jgi:DNA-binding NarL/FixJ family response regulator